MLMLQVPCKNGCLGENVFSVKYIHIDSNNGHWKQGSFFHGFRDCIPNKLKNINLFDTLYSKMLIIFLVKEGLHTLNDVKTFPPIIFLNVIVMFYLWKKTRRKQYVTWKSYSNYYQNTKKHVQNDPIWTFSQDDS